MLFANIDVKHSRQFAVKNKSDMLVDTGKV
jgi:hypothetical protein